MGKSGKFEKLGTYTANKRIKYVNSPKNGIMEKLDPNAMKYAEECIDHIWLNIGSGSISLDYAIAGYDMRTGEAVYDYDLLTALLLSYGYSAGITALFIEEFMGIDLEDGGRNVVLSSAKKADIFKNVGRLPDNPCPETTRDP